MFTFDLVFPWQFYLFASLLVTTFLPFVPYIFPLLNR